MRLRYHDSPHRIHSRNLFAMNFSEAVLAPVPREFLVVVLAGFGNEFSGDFLKIQRHRLIYHRVLRDVTQFLCSLSPLTNDYGEEPSPKALLPVANTPMISYTLQWIEDSGLKGMHLRNV